MSIKRVNAGPRMSTAVVHGDTVYLAGLTADDITVTPFPDYGQGVAVQQGTVDAATGFANNEPVQLQLAGETVSVLGVPATTPLPGPG